MEITAILEWFLCTKSSQNTPKVFKIHGEYA